MEVFYTAQAKIDLLYWQKTDPKKVVRISALIDSIKKNPSMGVGKPEALRFEKQSYWSRRIDHEHRLVYKVHKNCLYIAQCRYHYKK